MPSMLDRIRSFDAAPKIEYDFLQRTTTGACVSLVSMTLMVILFFAEVGNYFTPNREHSLVVDVSTVRTHTRTHAHAHAHAHANANAHAKQTEPNRTDKMTTTTNTVLTKKTMCCLSVCVAKLHKVAFTLLLRVW